MLRKRRIRLRTTNSKHNLYKYEDLLNGSSRFIPSAVGELVVSDIIYIAYEGGFAYLSLVPDAYIRCIVGYCLYPTLEAQGYLKALNQSLTFYQQHQIDVKGMIHHSDRGIQYASAEYTARLHG